MNKSTRIVKRLLALFLVVLMSINTFAAVVGDNDGSAFITKAEFDSLKNDFQSQIDRYNTSIDSKIDGAIASYLSGIEVKKTVINPFALGAGEDLVVINEKNVNDLLWGLADIDYKLFFNNTAPANPAICWFTLVIDMQRHLADANYEVFKIKNSETEFVSYSYGDKLSLSAALNFMGKASLTAMKSQPTQWLFRWHAQPWKHTVLNNDYAGYYFKDNEGLLPS